jgi:hypothetical protein
MESLKKVIEWINDNGWFVPIFSLVLGAYLSTFLTKNKEVLMKIADKKSQYYSEYVSAFLDFGVPSYIRLREGTNGAVNLKYLYVKNQVILYGSNEVIEKLSICEKHGIDINTEEGKKYYIDLIEAMKEDIENPIVIRNWWNKAISRDKRKEHISTILFGYKKAE